MRRLVNDFLENFLELDVNCALQVKMKLRNIFDVINIFILMFPLNSLTLNLLNCYFNFLKKISMNCKNNCKLMLHHRHMLLRRVLISCQMSMRCWSNVKTCAKLSSLVIYGIIFSFEKYWFSHHSETSFRLMEIKTSNRLQFNLIIAENPWLKIKIFPHLSSLKVMT